MTGRRGEGRLGDALGSFVRKLDREGGIAAARVAEEWPESAGPEIARHTAGVFLRKGELVVYVDSPIWATELSALHETLRETLNSRLGQELVRTIRFTVSRKVDEQRSREAEESKVDASYTEDVVESAPLSAVEVAQVRQSASVIRDDKLREVVVRATLKDLEWKHGIALRDAASKKDPQGL